MPAAGGVDQYQRWLNGELDEPDLEDRRQWILEHLPELRGVDLMCWCEDWGGIGEPPKGCHSEVLLEMANK